MSGVLIKSGLKNAVKPLRPSAFAVDSYFRDQTTAGTAEAQCPQRCRCG
jgi:hypothetical protein